MRRWALGALVAACTLTGCSSNKAKKPTRMGGGTAGGKLGAAAGSGKAWLYPADQQKSIDKFNLAEHIKNSKEAEGLHKFVQEGFTGMGFGSKDKLRVETNLTGDVIADKGNNDKGAVAKFRVDVFVFNKNYGGGDGSLIDYIARGIPDNPSRIDAHMRVFGDDKVANNDGVIDEHFMRDLGFTIPVVPLPPAQLIIKLNIGGEIGLKTQLGVRRNQQLNLLFVPDVNLRLTIAGGVRVLAVADGVAEGQIKLLAIKPALSANMGLDNALNYGNQAVVPGGINAIDGKIDLVVDLGYKGFLPGGIDKIAVNTALEKAGFGVIAKGKEWRWPVFNPEAVLNNSIPLYERSLVAFPKVPANVAECNTAAQSVGPVVSGHSGDLNAFVGKLEKDAKTVSEKSAALLSNAQSRVASFCK